MRGEQRVTSKKYDRYNVFSRKSNAFVVNIISTILFILLKGIFTNKNLALIMDCLIGVQFMIWLIIGIDFWVDKSDGYFLLDKEIQYCKFYKKIKIPYHEISCIIISAAFGRSSSYGYIGKRKGIFHIANYPWITLVKHQPTYFQNEWNIELHGGMIDQKTKDKDDYIYSFVPNEFFWESILLEKFEGTYYITYSIFARYHEEIRNSIKNHKIDKRRICLIKDKGDYTNFFREIDFNSVEKLKKDLFESS